VTIEIREAQSRKDLKKFVRFPFSLYKNNKYWIPPLIKEDIHTLRSDKNPSFEHCEAVYYLAYKNGKIVGRIAGIINRRFIEIWDKKYARFCWLDFIDDEEVSEALLKKVELWAQSKGMKDLIGPMGFTTFEHQGILIEGFDELPTFLSAYNYDYYLKHIEKLNYKKEVDYVEYEVKTPDSVPEKAVRLNKIIQKRMKVKLLKSTSMKELLPYAKQVFDVINEAYQPLFGFVPLTTKQVDLIVKKFVSFVRPEYISIVVNENDKVIGFQISAPSLSRAFQKAKGRLFPFGFIPILKAYKNPDCIDIILVGVHPDYQNKGINAIIMTDLTETSIKKNIRIAESNAEMEENVSVQNFWRYYDARQHKRKRIFIKHLSSE